MVGILDKGGDTKLLFTFKSLPTPTYRPCVPPPNRGTEVPGRESPTRSSTRKDNHIGDGEVSTTTR